MSEIVDEVVEAAKRKQRADYMREYRKKNREKYKEIDREARLKKKAKDPEKFARQLAERQKRYQAKKKLTETPEQREKRLAAHRLRCKKWKEKDPEKARRIARETAARLYAANPQKFIDITRRRQYKLAEGEVTAEQWDRIVAVYGGRCAYCREKVEELCQDHFIPLSKGGPHCADNIVPACRPCNTRKLNHIWPYPEPWVEPEPDPAQGV